MRSPTSSTTPAGDSAAADVKIVINLRNFERIELRAFGGGDSIDASGLTNPVELVLDGGAGSDTVIGSAGTDTLVVAAGHPTDGTPAIDRIEGCDQGQGGEIDLVGVTVCSAVDGGDLLLTLDSPDADPVGLEGVTDINDVIFVEAAGARHGGALAGRLRRGLPR